MYFLFVIRFAKEKIMPIISNFYGIVITMYNENNSRHNTPHFHARYAEHKASFDFNGKILEGKFPPKQARYIKVWAELRRESLITSWNLAMDSEEPLRIEPLK